MVTGFSITEIEKKIQSENTVTAEFIYIYIFPSSLYFVIFIHVYLGIIIVFLPYLEPKLEPKCKLNKTLSCTTSCT